MNTNVYLCSRMLFSLSRGQLRAAAARAADAATAVPLAAILTSGACILLAAAVSIFTPNAYGYLLGVALFAAILVWMIILLSHLSFRRHHAPEDAAGAHAAVPLDAVRGVAAARRRRW